MLSQCVQESWRVFKTCANNEPAWCGTTLGRQLIEGIEQGLGSKAMCYGVRQMFYCVSKRPRVAVSITVGDKRHVPSTTGGRCKRPPGVTGN